MQEIVAMDHPDARIVSYKADINGGMWLNEDRIQANRAPGQRFPIHIQHRKDVSMQMDGMIQIALIDQLDLDELPVLDHDHPGIGKDLSIHRVGHGIASQRGSHLVVEIDRIVEIESALWRDRRRSWLAISGQV